MKDELEFEVHATVVDAVDTVTQVGLVQEGVVSPLIPLYSIHIRIVHSAGVKNIPIPIASPMVSCCLVQFYCVDCSHLITIATRSSSCACALEMPLQARFPRARVSPSTSPTMDKAGLQNTTSSRDRGTSAASKPPRSSTPLRTWALALCTLLAGAWFLWPFSRCQHARVLSIEDRVQRILTHTPLIGKDR